MNTLELENVSKSFGGVRAVDRLSIGFGSGRITSLIGPNGAGKTTVFNLISGFLSPDEGGVYYREQNIAGWKPWHIAGLGIGRLFQDVRLFEHMPTLDNILVAFPHQKGESALLSVVARGRVKREESAIIDRALELLSFVGLEDKKDELAENLSYGQQKLLTIARLLAAESEVLLLDEPTAGVNPLMVDKIIDVIRRLATEGKTVAVIEHNMNVVIEISDWLYFMDEGRVISFGLPDEVLGDQEVRAAYIGL